MSFEFLDEFPSDDDDDSISIHSASNNPPITRRTVTPEPRETREDEDEDFGNQPLGRLQRGVSSAENGDQADDFGGNATSRGSARPGGNGLCPKDYTQVARRIAVKRKFSRLQEEELVEFAKEKDPEVRRLNLYASTIAIRDCFETLKANQNQNWSLPTEAAAELAKEIYSYLLSPRCPSYVGNASSLLMTHYARLRLAPGVFMSQLQRKELNRELGRLLADRRSFMLKKLRKSLGQNLAEVQKSLSISHFPFKFEARHWARFAFIRASLRAHDEHIKRARTSSDEPSDEVPRDFWSYMDNCLIELEKGCKHDRLKVSNKLRNMLNRDKLQYPVNNSELADIAREGEHGQFAWQQDTEQTGVPSAQLEGGSS